MPAWDLPRATSPHERGFERPSTATSCSHRNREHPTDVEPTTQTRQGDDERSHFQCGGHRKDVWTSSVHRPSPVNNECLSRHVTKPIGRQNCYRISDLIGLSDTTHRNL